MSRLFLMVTLVFFSSCFLRKEHLVTRKYSELEAEKTRSELIFDSLLLTFPESFERVYFASDKFWFIQNKLNLEVIVDKFDFHGLDNAQKGTEKWCLNSDSCTEIFSKKLTINGFECYVHEQIVEFTPERHSQFQIDIYIIVAEEKFHIKMNGPSKWNQKVKEVLHNIFGSIKLYKMSN